MEEWQQFFIDGGYEVDDMYKAFKERMYHEAETGVDFNVEVAEAEQAQSYKEQREEDNLLRYEKEEHYRRVWAAKQNYTFKPREYDPNKRYKR